MVHAFRAAGLLTQQYISFCRIARLGIIGKRYIYQGKNVFIILQCIYYEYTSFLAMYHDLHYLESVELEAERSMLASVKEVQALPHYELSGEVRMLHCTWVYVCMVCIAVIPFPEYSGSLLMLATIQQLMHIILLFHACLDRKFNVL